MTYKGPRNYSLEDDIIKFAYAYQTIDRDLIVAGIPEARDYSQEELEAIIFLSTGEFKDE